MPLTPGKSRAVVSQNIREFSKGQTYQKTASKFGLAKAHKQAVAVAMNQRRKSGGK